MLRTPSRFARHVCAVTLLAAIAGATPAAEAQGTSGSVLAAPGTATVDGVLSPGEWDRAAGVDFAAAIPPREGGGTAPARMYLMNDSSRLFLAVRVARPSYGLAADTIWFFDRNYDGVHEDGDDQVSIHISRFGGLDVSDGYRWRCPGAPVGAIAHCGAGKDTLQVEGAPPPGQVDALGAASEGDGFVTFELSHPLDSADDAHDFSLGPGSVIGYRHFLRLWASTCVEAGCWADAGPPDGRIGISPPAELAVRASVRPRSVRVGARLTYSITVENRSGTTAAGGVYLTVPLPRSVRGLSARTDVGRCEVNGPATCSIGAMGPGRRVSIVVQTLARRAGSANVTALVSTTSFDATGSDDESTAIARVTPRRR
jgi:uncharacterized repeat protein (TIGR01451 family)